MKSLIFALPGNETLAKSLVKSVDAEIGQAEIRSFPDGETYIRVASDVKNRRCILVCSLDRPDSKLLPLYFLSQTIKNLGGRCTCLVAPYLAYMRQDKQFKPGEGVTSKYFAALVSQFAHSLITVDPHLHRRSSLAEIYSIPTEVVHAAAHISNWIKNNVDQPVLIGPDSESEQWVAEVARDAGAPFIILEKTRRGDRDVEVSVPRVETYKDHTPVLVDDIISTARTMIETVGHLERAGMKAPVCIGVHAVFAGDAYNELQDAGTKQIVTCNTIPHPSNQIGLEKLYVDFIQNTNFY
ncbi:ribose-phosphate pyrophosphokinase [Aliifodinibius sp. S!AR15-10]|jgi:ribose-phosphate pyrophosphokinase|uniref:ribose-phosphate pyrophosphokinase n=1 Tax=Aliifodinibius sp. S!AR15-10 TaxID=2950437 RepID=UPI0028559DC4|nr:ribose-phosphate pyrophosphokinase [Aliifodinibius sp. S!AR15-10]MDR8391471.1 ribose-phosphate pyrophosphokinase [Aliifodinibius sp. S!AR15-10]